jgi:serine/threonine-protein kinase
MELNVLSISNTGPVRQKNEDCLAFWEPEDLADKVHRGAIAIVADGCGGHGNGDVASRMAVDFALKAFQEADVDISPKRLLKEIFNGANMALYDAAINDRKVIRMATTLTVCIFRDKELHIGHVGDSRVYLVRHEEIQRLTNDHSMTGLHLRLRLMTDHEARVSHLRSMLTRSVGPEPVVHMDYKKLTVYPHDRIVQCTDGLYCYIDDGEICEGVDRLNEDEICSYLTSLAERRGTDDNLSVQFIEIKRYSKLPEKPLSILHHTEPSTTAGSNELQPGYLLDGRFRIVEMIGKSGMAAVYKATDIKKERVVALKIPHMQFESDVAFYSRFQREAEIGLKLDHPNILKFYDVPEKSRLYIVMELLQGRPLSEIMAEVKPFPIADVVQIGSRVCNALAHMHSKGIIHRDIKPQNIMICTDGSLRIFDFGIARAAEMRRLTFVGFTPAMGTPDYMAPEQVKGKRGDERTDIYSLGAILYELATGKAPFEAENPFLVMNARVTGDPVAPREINPDLPPELEEIILHAMEREPFRRFASADLMKAELEDFTLVRMTDRSDRLQTPKIWNIRWQSSRLYIFSILIPLVIFLLGFLLTRCAHH